jgi:hypothetical protein
LLMNAVRCLARLARHSTHNGSTGVADAWLAVANTDTLSSAPSSQRRVNRVAFRNDIFIAKAKFPIDKCDALPRSLDEGHTSTRLRQEQRLAVHSLLPVTLTFCSMNRDLVRTLHRNISSLIEVFASLPVNRPIGVDSQAILHTTLSPRVHLSLGSIGSPQEVHLAYFVWETCHRVGQHLSAGFFR